MLRGSDFCRTFRSFLIWLVSPFAAFFACKSAFSLGWKSLCPEFHWICRSMAPLVLAVSVFHHLLVFQKAAAFWSLFFLEVSQPHHGCGQLGSARVLRRLVGGTAPSLSHPPMRMSKMSKMVPVMIVPIKSGSPLSISPTHPQFIYGSASFYPSHPHYPFHLSGHPFQLSNEAGLWQWCQSYHTESGHKSSSLLLDIMIAVLLPAIQLLNKSTSWPLVVQRYLSWIFEG